MKPILTFGELLRILLKDDKSQVEWAKALGTTQPQLNNIMTGRRKIMMADAQRWAEVLGLPKEVRNRFLRLAATTHIPAEARPTFVAMIYELESLARKVDRRRARR